LATMNRSLAPKLWKFIALLLTCSLIFAGRDVLANQEEQKLKKMVGVDEHLGEKIQTDLEFQDHFGKTITLAEYVNGDKPVIVSLNYYSCETLCSVQLNSLVEGLKTLDWLSGEDFNTVTISIDPDEDSNLAARKRGSYLNQLGRAKADWTFLVGEQEQITEIAQEFGFRYFYDEKSKQYAHPAVVMVLSPEGQISRYLYGLDYTAQDLKFALMEAAEGKIGTTLDRIILSCFIYDNTTGKYTQDVRKLMMAAGLTTVFFLSLMVTVLWRRELKGA
jgi:protein SCO1/2